MPETDRGTNLVTIIMVAVQAVGVGVTVGFVQEFTGIPLWAAGIIGFPIFFVVFWGGFWLLRGRK